MKNVLYSLPISLIFGILVFYINWNYFSLLTILIFIIYIFYYDTAKEWRNFIKNQKL
jgi:hypothetical protein